MKFFINSLALFFLWIECVNSESCGAGCGECRSNGCSVCKEGYYSRKRSYICKLCPDSCKKCYNRTETNTVSCTSCKDEYYLNGDNCLKCYDGCAKCTAKYTCSQCKDGYWGKSCLYSCFTCSDCIEEKCKNRCEEKDSRFCNHEQSKCPNKCSIGFTGPRKNDIYTLPPTADTTSPSTSMGKTRRPVTKRSQLPLTTTTLPPTQTRTTKTSTIFHLITTSLKRHDTTTQQSDVTVYPEQPIDETRTNGDGTTLQAESQTEGFGTPELYMVIAVVGGLLVLVAVILVVVCIKRRKSRQDHVTCPQDVNNKAESRQLADNAGRNTNVSHHGMAIGNIPTINLDESHTGYVDINTIDHVATINVAESNTGYVDLNTTAYENIVYEYAVNATDTGNVYENLTQYTNVRDAVNAYTSLRGNESVYYNILD